MYPYESKKGKDGRIYIPVKHNNPPGWKKVEQVDSKAKTKKLEAVSLGWWFKLEWRLLAFVRRIWGSLKGGGK